jgi:hypothetical protein
MAVNQLCRHHNDQIGVIHLDIMACPEQSGVRAAHAKGRASRITIWQSLKMRRPTP